MAILMKKFGYNDRVGMLEIDPHHLSDGLAHAKENGYDEIRIRSQNMDYGSRLEIDLDTLTRCSFITKLDVADNVEVKSSQLDLLSRLVSLRHLSFENPTFKIDFKNLPQLEGLAFKFNKGVKNLDSLANLKRLLVRSYNGVDCSLFASLVSLERMDLVRGSLVSLHGVERLERLTDLLLKYLSRLEDATAMAHLVKLERLHVEKCKRLVDFSFLAGNGSIQDLFISELESVAFVESMPELRKFVFWKADDGDLSPLLRARRLKDLHFHPDRKHYSHKKDEIVGRLGGFPP